MTIQTAKPFASYVAERELPRAGDARKFEFHFLYQVEGTSEIASYHWPWRYSGTQEAIDEKAGVDGYAGRRVPRAAEIPASHRARITGGRGEALFCRRPENPDSGQGVTLEGTVGGYRLNDLTLKAVKHGTRWCYSIPTRPNLMPDSGHWRDAARGRHRASRTR